MATDPLATFLPTASVAERALRQRLLKAQALASGRAAAAASDPARALLWMITDVTAAWAFAPASDENLQDIADGMVRLLMVAEMFERVEAERAR